MSTAVAVANWAFEQLARDAENSDCVAIVSGGLDSCTLVYHLIAAGHKPHVLSFDYGQRHKKELFYAQLMCQQLGLRHTIIDLSGLTQLISNSSLTGAKEVPDGHYAEENMKATVVPNRNMIMLSIAAGVMVNNSYKFVATGVHAGDHFIYPDCRPGFIGAMNDAIVEGNQGFGAIPVQDEDYTGDLYKAVFAPFLESSKADIAYRAFELGVPLHMTWSCYKGGDVHCGRCGTCVERLEAIEEADQRARANGILPDGLHSNDQTVYADDEFYKTAAERLEQ